MRKYLIGALIGIALSISVTTYADDITSLIGKSVQGVFPVKVNGDTLAKTAIVIDGTSYLPVRAIGDAIGYDVSFNADLGIELKKKEGTRPMTAANVTPTELGTDIAPLPAYDPAIVYALDDIEKIINSENATISTLKFLTDNEADSPKVIRFKGYLQKYQDDLALWEARKAALTP